MQIASLFIKQKSNTSEKKLAVVPNIFMKITQGADLSLLFKNGQERKKDWAVVLTNSIIMSFPCDEIIGSMGLMIEGECGDGGSQGYLFITLALLTASPSFAVSIMPFVIYDCLLRESQKKCFEAGENSFRYILSSSLSQLLSTQLDQLNLELSICLIRVFECLVSNSNPSALLQNQYWGWLDVDYLLISRLAIRCKFYSSALFFCEIHAMKLAESSSSQSSRLALDSPDVFKVLLAANEHLHLADGFDGVSLLASNHNIPLDISRKYRHNGQWEKLFELEESRAATTGNPASMLLAMSRLGYHDLLRTLMNGLSSSKDTAGTLSDACYDLYDECVWRQSLWDLPELPFSPSRGKAL